MQVNKLSEKVINEKDYPTLKERRIREPLAERLNQVDIITEIERKAIKRLHDEYINDHREHEKIKETLSLQGLKAIDELMIKKG